MKESPWTTCTGARIGRVREREVGVAAHRAVHAGAVGDAEHALPVPHRGVAADHGHLHLLVRAPVGRDDVLPGSDGRHGRAVPGRSRIRRGLGHGGWTVGSAGATTTATRRAPRSPRSGAARIAAPQADGCRRTGRRARGRAASPRRRPRARPAAGTAATDRTPSERASAASRRRSGRGPTAGPWRSRRARPRSTRSRMWRDPLAQTGAGAPPHRPRPARRPAPRGPAPRPGCEARLTTRHPAGRSAARSAPAPAAAPPGRRAPRRGLR